MRWFTCGFAALTSLMLTVEPAAAQTPAPPLQTCQLGDLKLESGQVIRDFKMTYITFGKLNADKSNAIFRCTASRGIATAKRLGRGRAVRSIPTSIL